MGLLPLYQSREFKTSIIIFTENQLPMAKKITHWNAEEELSYHFFLTCKADELLNNPNNKPQGYYVEMSKFIGSRDQKQCRSHHQKMVARFKNKSNSGRQHCEEKNLRKFYCDHIQLRLLDGEHLMKEINHHLTKKVQKGHLSKEGYHIYKEKAESNIPRLEQNEEEIVKTETETKPLAFQEEKIEEMQPQLEDLSAFQVFSPFYQSSSSGLSDYLGEAFRPIDFEEEVFEEEE